MNQPVTEPALPNTGATGGGGAARHTAEALMRRFRWDAVDRLGSEAWSLMGVVALLVAVGYALGQLGWLLLPAALAAVSGILASPLVNRLERRGMNRLLATLLVFGGITVAMVVFTWALVPPFVTQLSKLASGIPDVLGDLADSAKAFEKRFGAGDPAAAEAIRSFGKGLQDAALGFADGLSGTLLDIVTFAFAGGVALLLGTIIGFLAVKDLPNYARPMNRWLELRRGTRLACALRDMGNTLTSFVRGQMLKAVVVAIIDSVLLSLIGVPYSMPLGALKGVGTFIPTLGPILAGTPAVVLAWASGGPTLALLALGATLTVQLIDDYVLIPLIVGNAVEMPPLQVMVALTVAGGTLGVAGMVVAVPVLAMARDGLRWFFMDDDAVAPAAAALEAELKAPRRRRPHGAPKH